MRSNNQEARSKKEEVSSKNQEAMRKDVEARDKKQDARSKNQDPSTPITVHVSLSELSDQTPVSSVQCVKCD